ncbi:accessory Sec system protein Asp2 [Microbacterium stercoris]|uniref:Accessory Sec system protein Asp2 n=1 Tax=Microbacterium stercoris TaxID=2820289 RepID=A0A939TPB3_9MICO|nr:accessory Sec system protein Asp2 [Microbacterium stercoris]MBO3662205.1 accessory Sec system protein Asp2 [Microbacterium stercoris]
MRVLQIGRDDWSAAARIPSGVSWEFVDAGSEAGFDPALIGRVDVTILDAPCEPRHLQAVAKVITPHTLLVERNVASGSDEVLARLLSQKAAVVQDMDDRQALIDLLPNRYFAKPFGQKLEIRRTKVSPLHPSPAWYEGNAYLVTDVDHEGDFRQLMMWKENILYENHRALELWPEYVKDGECEVQLVVQLIQSGTSDVIAFHRTYSEEELAEPIIISDPSSGYLSCSIFAKGRGRVKVGPIHYRHSRDGAGHFLPGGRRIVDSRREELFTYFHPGDLTPPLNIYFSGYRPAEGFEGYFMMAGLGHPFLLITDPRLEGGRFYLASDELEGRLHDVIREHIDALGFEEEDVIFSGLSMGSFGALYYGSQFRAHAIIAGKPIIDLGYLAERGRLVRPQEFLTILDIVNFWNKTNAQGEPSTADEFTGALLDRWRGDPGFGETKILMSYMKQDDYDDAAYFTLLDSQSGKATEVIARGYQGRHNDDSPSIVSWFAGQFRRVIDEYTEARNGG